MERRDVRSFGITFVGVWLFMLVGGSRSDAQDRLKQAANVYSTLMQRAQADPPRLEQVQARGAEVSIVNQKPKFDPVQAPGFCGNKPVKLGMKVWAELVGQDGQTGTGQYVNLERYRFKPKERFYLWFESASPIQISLFQHYYGPTATKDSRLVLPQPDYPKSYETLLSGKPVRYPILLETDNDLRQELMSIVAYTPGTPFAGNQPLPICTVSSLSTNVQVTQAMAQTSQQLSSTMNQNVVVQVAQNGSPTLNNLEGDGVVISRAARFDAVASPTATAPSANSDDVASVLLGSQNIGHGQFVLTK